MKFISVALFLCLVSVLSTGCKPQVESSNNEKTVLQKLPDSESSSSGLTELVTVSPGSPVLNTNLSTEGLKGLELSLNEFYEAYNRAAKENGSLPRLGPLKLKNGEQIVYYDFSGGNNMALGVKDSGEIVGINLFSRYFPGETAQKILPLIIKDTIQAVRPDLGRQGVDAVVDRIYQPIVNNIRQGNSNVVVDLIQDQKLYYGVVFVPQNGIIFSITAVQ